MSDKSEANANPIALIFPSADHVKVAIMYEVHIKKQTFTFKKNYIKYFAFFLF